MTNKYKTLPFKDVIKVASKTKGVKKTEYKECGKYPIIDQGQSFITAYSDNYDLVEQNIPLIIFGDHTRVFKYIDFPATFGNDGVKILRPATGLNAKFLYYQMLNLKIPNTGYNRHFKFLSEKVLQITELSIQQKIAEILSTVDEAILKTDQIIKKSEELKIGLMNELLTKGISHKKFKKTKLGEIPEEWAIIELSTIALVERGKFSHRPRNDPKFYGGSIPFIQTGDVVNSKGRIKNHSQTLNEQGLSVSKMFPKGTIVLTIAANIGDTGILEFDACFPDSLVGIQPYSNVDSIFLEYFLKSRKSYLNSIATQSAQKNINLAKLNPMLVLLPSLDEQKKIAEILSSLYEEIIRNTFEKERLTVLKSGLMQDIFSQKVQIN